MTILLTAGSMLYRSLEFIHLENRSFIPIGKLPTVSIFSLATTIVVFDPELDYFIYLI